MPNECISIEELARKRTPSDLLNWVRQKIEQMKSTDEGEKALTLHEGLAKHLIEEVYPLAMFGWHKFGNIDQILLQPIIGNQSYDAVITDLRSTPACQSYVEITQSDEGEADYLRRLVLQTRGFVFMHSTVSKTGTKRTGRQVSIPAKAVTPDEIATKELTKILDAAKRKASRDYPIDTSLIIAFDDNLIFKQAIDDAKLGGFAEEHILKLDLRFSTLCLVGWKDVFREFSLGKQP